MKKILFEFCFNLLNTLTTNNEKSVQARNVKGPTISHFWRWVSTISIDKNMNSPMFSETALSKSCTTNFVSN